MDKVYNFPNRIVVEEEASVWLVRLDSDKPLSEQEFASLKEWIRRSPLHRDELMSLADFWQDQSLVALPISIEELCYGANLKPQKRFVNLWQTSKLKITAVSLATSFGLLLILGYFSFLSEDVDIKHLHNNLYATAVGQQNTIVLSDGSIVDLNTNTQIKVDFSNSYRAIYILQGEAHFDVVKDAGKPFLVYAGLGRVRAIGTAFTVRYHPNTDVEVTVSEGVVGLGVLNNSSTGKEFSDLQSQHREKSSISKYYVSIPVDELGTLEKGQTTKILVAKSVSNKNVEPKLDNIKHIAQGEMKREASWRSGVLVFSGNSLEEVVHEISRYTTLSIHIVDPELKKIRIGGSFDVNNTDALFDALEANFGVQINRLDYNRVEIISASSNKS